MTSRRSPAGTRPATAILRPGRAAGERRFRVLAADIAFAAAINDGLVAAAPSLEPGGAGADPGFMRVDAGPARFGQGPGRKRNRVG